MTRRNRRVKLCVAPRFGLINGAYENSFHGLVAVPIVYRDEEPYNWEVEIVTPLDFVD